jgi:prepilin-type N-terminal cleavage/methylation domain-containing protein
MAFPTILIISLHELAGKLKRFQLRASAPKQFERGFSLPELLIALAVGLILAATGILLASTATNEVRLNSSGTNYANLLQSARMRAVRDDAFYKVLVDCGTVGSAAPCTGTTPARAFIDLNGNGNYDSGEPVATFAAAVSPQTFASGPAEGNLASQFLPASAVTTVASTSIPIFGTRGLPCKVSGGACPYLDANGLPVSYITFIQNTRGGKWEAITVNPASRIREWAYNGTTWTPLN